MTVSEIDKKVLRFRKEHKLKKADYKSLFAITESLGYTVIEFNSLVNEQNVADLAEALNLEQEMLHSRGFTYASGEYRLVFINESLSEKEKTIVLSHELGHIELGHLSRQKIVGQDVQEEFEANEFSNFLLKSDKKVTVITACYKKALIAAALALTAVIAVVCVVVFSPGTEKTPPLEGDTAVYSYNEEEDSFGESELFRQIKEIAETNLSTIQPNLTYDSENHLIRITSIAPEGTRKYLTNSVARINIQEPWDNLCDALAETARTTYTTMLENSLNIGCAVMILADDDPDVCLFAALNGKVYCNVGADT